MTQPAIVERSFPMLEHRRLRRADEAVGSSVHRLSALRAVAPSRRCRAPRGSAGGMISRALTAHSKAWGLSRVPTVTAGPADRALSAPTCRRTSVQGSRQGSAPHLGPASFGGDSRARRANRAPFHAPPSAIFSFAGWRLAAEGGAPVTRWPTGQRRPLLLVVRPSRRVRIPPRERAGPFLHPTKNPALGRVSCARDRGLIDNPNKSP